MTATKVACIMDPFTFGAFSPEADLLQLSPVGWERQLDSFRPDILFVESAWQGKDDLWAGGRVAKPTQLTGIVEWCHQHEVPTAFWNKEDPVHFTTFLNTSALFDFVFTTDLDCIGRYKAALGHQRVHLLPFANQPRLFNPIETEKRLNAFGFAGAHYERYPDRARDFHNMVDELTKLHPLLIWDRNYGKEDPRYAFPPKYAPFILGHLPLDGVEHAYKGYRYALNLNSVKQSQTMMARRVFELLGSGNVVVSNYARSIRVLFGDLVLASDDAAELADRIIALEADQAQDHRYRLAGVRKVMSEHTYGDRFRYVRDKVLGPGAQRSVASVAMIGVAHDRREAIRLVESFRVQAHSAKTLTIVAGTDAEGVADLAGSDVTVIGGAGLEFGDHVRADYVAGISPRDHYGANYLRDLTLAGTYSDEAIIGKGAYFRTEAGETKLRSPGIRYRVGVPLALRRAVVRSPVLGGVDVFHWASQLEQALPVTGLSVDEFNYCEDGADDAGAWLTADDGLGASNGMAMSDLQARSESVPLTPRNDDPDLGPEDTAGWFDGIETSWLASGLEAGEHLVGSSLEDGSFQYVWGGRIPVGEIMTSRPQRLFFDAGQGLDMRLAFRYLDSRLEAVGSTVILPNDNTEIDWPAEAVWVVPGLRVSGPGHAVIRGIHLRFQETSHPLVIARSENLVVTNIYPSKAALYRNAFVHRRVISYRSRGVSADVFRFQDDIPLRFEEFEGVDVFAGPAGGLRALLESNRFGSVMVHFLNTDMWQVLRDHLGATRLVVFIHGFEIQAWHRRQHEFEDEDALAKARLAGDRRLEFWKQVFDEGQENVHFVFVSQYLANQVFEDLGIELASSSYSVIHNPIDTALFDYQPKDPSQRLKILSVRPFASTTYANDLSVRAILDLKEKQWFSQLEIRIVGEGPLFAEITEPLRELPNVTLDNRFLSPREIAALHKEYGVFLVPSRMDTQGVSRDEAMSSGLVPVTNRVGAVPEFLDETSGFMAQPEDAAGLARAIELLVEDPSLFQKMSQAAAARVRAQSDERITVTQELELIGAAAPEDALGVES